MECVVTTDVSTANEPLLATLSSDKYINRFMNYPTTGGNADELALITSMCKGIRKLVEKELNLAIGSQTRTAYFTYKEAKRKEFLVDLPYGPHSSISTVHVDYADDTDDYSLDVDDDILTFGNQYKSIRLANVFGTSGSGEVAGYKIKYVCGFGASGCETLPEAITMIMAKELTQWYAKRDNYTQTLSKETRNSLQQFRRKSWI